MPVTYLTLLPAAPTATESATTFPLTANNFFNSVYIMVGNVNLTIRGTSAVALTVLPVPPQGLDATFANDADTFLAGLPVMRTEVNAIITALSLPCSAVTALPTIPSRSGDPVNFASRAAALVAALTLLRTELNDFITALIAYIPSGGPFTSTGKFGMPGVFGGSPQSGSWGAFAGRVTLTQLNARMDANSTFSTYSLYMGGSVAAGDKFKPVLYSDSSGVPGALIATGSEITLAGTEANSTQTFSFGATVTLTHGTKYWFGLFTDSSWFWPQSSGTGGVANSRNKDGFTYASGPPSSLTGTSDTGGIVNIVANVTTARGVGGFWDSYNNVGGDTAAAANEIYLVKVTIPGGGANISSVGIRLSATVTVGGHMKGLIYSDSAGSPSSRVAIGSQVTVAAAYDELQSAFSGVFLAAGDFWIGVVTDSAQHFESADGATKRMTTGVTYASPPSTFTVSGSSTVLAGFYLLFS